MNRMLELSLKEGKVSKMPPVKNSLVGVGNADQFKKAEQGRTAIMYLLKDKKMTIGEICEATGTGNHKTRSRLNVLKTEGLVDIVEKRGSYSIWGRI